MHIALHHPDLARITLKGSFLGKYKLENPHENKRGKCHYEAPINDFEDTP